MLLVTLLACTRSEPPDPTSALDPGDGGPTDTGAAPPPGTGLYDPTVIHAIALTLPDATRTSLTDDPTTYAPARVVVDGQVFEEIGVRIKGSATRRPLTGKPSFRLDLDRYVDQDLDGAEAIQLHNLIMDRSQMHERLAWAAVEAAGLPSARVSFARVTVDGEDYGLYSVVEPFDGDWLQRTRPEAADGNLYEGGLLNGETTWTLADFTAEGSAHFDLEEGTDVQLADVLAVTAVAEDTASADGYADLRAVVDVKTLHRTLALEAWLAQADGYLGYANNFRVYFDPDSGLAELWLQGLDLTFTDPGWYGLSSPAGALAARCFADEACWADFATTAAEVSAAIDAADLETLKDDTWELLEPEVETDPKRTFSVSDVAAAQEQLDVWLDSRSGGLLAAVEQGP